VGRTEINAQGQNDLCYVSESLLGKLTGGTENLPIYRGSVKVFLSIAKSYGKNFSHFTSLLNNMAHCTVFSCFSLTLFCGKMISVCPSLKYFQDANYS